MLTISLTIPLPKMTIGIEDCYDKESNLDFGRWTWIKTERRLANLSLSAAMMIMAKEDFPWSKAKRRRTKTMVAMIIEHDGNIIPLQAFYSAWYISYVGNPHLESSKFHYKLCCPILSTIPQLFITHQKVLLLHFVLPMVCPQCQW